MVTIEVNLDPFVKLGSYIKNNITESASAFKNNIAESASAFRESATELARDLGISKERLPQVVCRLSFAANISQLVFGYFSLPHFALTAATIIGFAEVPVSEQGKYLLNKRDVEYLKTAQSNLVIGAAVTLIRNNPLSSMVLTLSLAKAGNDLAHFITIK